MSVDRRKLNELLLTGEFWTTIFKHVVCFLLKKKTKTVKNMRQYLDLNKYSMGESMFN